MAGSPFDKGPGGNAATATADKPAAKNGAAKAKATKAAEVDEGGTVDISPRRDPFAMPSGGGGDYKFTDFLDELLLVKPIEEDIIATKISSETEVMRVDVVRLDNENERCDDLLVFQSALLRTLRRAMRGPNNWTLGRLEMGEAKNGKNAPYILTKPDDDEIAAAIKVATELNLDL